MQLINNSLVLTQAYWVILTYSELLPYFILIQVHGNFKPLINGSIFEKWKKKIIIQSSKTIIVIA